MSDLINDIFSKLDNFGQTESSAADTTNNDENKVSVSAADVIARVRAKAQANANNNAAKEENNLSPPSARAAEIIARVRAKAQAAANNAAQPPMPDVGVTKEKRENKTSASSSIDDIMASVMSKPKEKDENKTSAGSIADIMASVKSEPKSEIKENKTSSIADIMASVMSTSGSEKEGSSSSGGTEDILAMVRASVGATGELPKINTEPVKTKRSDGKGNLFDELENINLDTLYNGAAEVTKTDRKINTSNLPSAEDCLYDKTFECPCCEKEFKARVVRKNKARIESVDIDLKNNYVPIQPDYYDVIMCEHCGYASVASKFNQITDRQVEMIKENITKKYVHKKYPSVYDIDTALERFKIALLNAMAKKAKSGEKALLCLKIAWIYRDKNDKQNEMNYLRSAYEGFTHAFTNETFPIFGMDENTIMYLLSALAYKMGDYEESKRTLGKLLVRRGIPARLRERAENLRDIIRSKEKK